MYNNRANYILVGCFVAAMIVAAVGSIAVLTGRTGPTDRYFVSLGNVADIKFGTQVRFEGFPVGQVERIEAGEQPGPGRFRIEISVKQGWRIPVDSVTRIGSSNFLGAKTLDIESGHAVETVALGGDIPSAAPSDMFTAMRGAASQLTSLSEGTVKPLLGTLHSLVSTFNRDTPRITDELVTFTRRLNESLTPIQAILADENVQAIRRTIENTESTTQTIAGASQTIAGASQDLALSMNRLLNMTANLDALVDASDTDVEQTLKDLRYTLAAMARSVDTIVYNFDGTARNMNEFSRLIRNNPAVLLGSTPREAVSEAKVSQPEDTR